MNAHDTALHIVRTLQQAGFETYWVGGCVRDRLLGREPKDYDVATAARPEQIEALFPHTIGVGRQFGVLIVLVEQNAVQVATFRTDLGYRDGRHPEAVAFAEAHDDAVRRDFTVNGLFYDPLTDTLHDWVNGAADLRARVIRCIGDPALRFEEDRLRVLRAIRFAAELGFTLDPATSDAAKRFAPRLDEVSPERIAEELRRLFAPPHAARGLDLLRDHDLLARILPELAATLDCPQPPEWHPEGSVYEHIRLMLGLMPSPADPLLPWTILLHDIAKPATLKRDPTSGAIQFHGHEKVGAEMTETILGRLRFPRKSIQTVRDVVRWHMQFKDVPEMRKSTLKRMLARPTFPLELELHRLDCLGSHGRLDHFHRLTALRTEMPPAAADPPPLLNGRDLLRLGLRSGPRIGQLLAEVRERQLQEDLRTPADALAYVKRRLAQAPSDEGSNRSGQ